MALTFYLSGCYELLRDKFFHLKIKTINLKILVLKLDVVGSTGVSVTSEFNVGLWQNIKNYDKVSCLYVLKVLL